MPTLHWLNDEDARCAARSVPYRLLEADPALSYGDPQAQNLLIQGDNLAALKSLLPYYAGQVKCIFIDPPYNTGSAFSHYEDSLEHSTWLTLMYPRLELLRELLMENGSIWVSIDDNEGHYLKVILDEIFGRRNFVANIIWQKKFAPQNDAKLLDPNHDHIMVFAKNQNVCSFNLLPRSESMDARYKNPDNDPRGPWASDNPLRREYREYAYYEIVTPSGRTVLPPPGTSWRFNKEEVPQLMAENRLWFGKDGKGVPRIKRFLSEVKSGLIPQSIWLHDDVGNTQEAKKEVIRLNSSNIFDTPKPERLIQRIINIATNPGDLVLDSFLGSGTTAAVAHKMGRRYIGIELGEHAVTHCVPRLKKVVDGEQGGISQAVHWQGGGGFRFYRLGEPVFDETDRIAPGVTFRAWPRTSGLSRPGRPIPARSKKLHKRPRCWAYRRAAPTTCCITAFWATIAPRAATSSPTACCASFPRTLARAPSTAKSA
jgi:adenine-specific DNA-methyltransferase